MTSTQSPTPKSRHEHANSYPKRASLPGTSHHLAASRHTSVNTIAVSANLPAFSVMPSTAGWFTTEPPPTHYLIFAISTPGTPLLHKTNLDVPCRCSCTRTRTCTCSIPTPTNLRRSISLSRNFTTLYPLPLSPIMGRRHVSPYSLSTRHSVGKIGKI